MENKYGLILSHLQERALEKQIKEPDKSNLINNCKTLIEIFRDNTFPIAISFYHKAKLVPYIQKEISGYDHVNIFKRSQGSNFFSEEWTDFFKDLNGIVIAGIFADGCMCETAREGSKNNFNIFTASDLTDNRVPWGRQQLKDHLNSEIYGTSFNGKFFENYAELEKALFQSTSLKI